MRGAHDERTQPGRPARHVGRRAACPRPAVGQHVARNSTLTTRDDAGTQSVPVAWFDPPAAAATSPPGRRWSSSARVRRRFFRAGGATQSADRGRRRSCRPGAPHEGGAAGAGSAVAVAEYARCMSEIRTDFEPGVITGSDVKDVFALAKAKGFALPAANCTGSQHDERRDGGGRGAQLAGDHPVLPQRRGVHRRQGHRRRRPGVDPRLAGRGGARQHARRRLRRAGDPAHRPLRQGQARLGRRPARGRREALRRARPAAVQLAHARPLRGAAGGERGDVQGATSSARRRSG